MTSFLIEFYVLIIILMMMIAYAGFEGTMRVFVYLELQIKYAYIRFIMWRMGRKLKKQLLSETNHLLKEINAKKSHEKD
jgi:hypothetical protein